MLTILVTGATGNIGKEVAAELAARGDVRVIAGSREVSRAAKQFEGLANVHAVQLDLAVPETVEAALKGVDKVFLLNPLGSDMARQTASLVTAAKRAGVKYIVRLSVMGADEADPVLTGAWHKDADEVVRKGGIPFSILRPNQYFQNLINFGVPESVKAQGAIYQPLGDSRVSDIDTRDIAAAAAAILLDDKGTYAGGEFTLTGAEAYSRADAARVIGELLGKPVTYVAVPEEPVREGLTSAGVPPENVEAILGWFAYCRAGRATRVTGDTERLIGRKPRSLRAFAEEHAAAYR